MTDRPSFSRQTRSRRFARHSALLTGVSVVAMFMVNPQVHAKPLGSWTPAPSAAAIAASQSGQQDAARAARDAQNSLKRATQAIQAMQAAQSAARNAARANPPSGIPNGLRPGGLQVAPGAGAGSDLWQGANLPTEFNDGERTKVTVGQTQAKAILTWQTFNISEKTDLRFDQKGNSNWVALNRVLDNTRPSKILGSVEAEGSVYVINQNGIIFGGTSQVNVGALIASTANIPTKRFLDDGIYSEQVSGGYLPSFTDAGGLVKVEAGATIETHAPTSVTAGGGFVLLMGSSVENAGSISTPKGQTTLAAGDDFILRRGYGADANQGSTTRGSEIAAVIRAGSLTGNVTNNGLIFSQQGDITLAGRTIAQNGILISTASVNARGTIHLLNAASDTLGSITLGASSLTDILIELDSDETALDSQRDGLKAVIGQPNASGQFDNLGGLTSRGDQSLIEIVTGGDVVFKGRSATEDGSLTIAQGGQVNVGAGRRIFTDDGATIDVSGVRDVMLPMSANNILVNIQGNELRDSPLNRDNDYLKNANVWIDIRDLVLLPAGTGGYETDRYYTPGGLLEVGGQLNLLAHGIGEWAALGGTITLAAPEVIAQQGSIFDISGGSIRYDGGYITTTNFLGGDSRTYNINNARGDMTFYGLGNGFVRTSERWGITEVWMNPFGKGRVSTRWEDGYTVGRDAGKLALSTPTSIFEGTILADVVTGTRQTSERPDGVADGYTLTQNTAPLAGALILANQSGSIDYNTDVVFGNLVHQTGALTSDSAIDPPRQNTAWFDAGLINSFKLGGLTVETGKTIVVTSDLSLAHGGQLSFNGSSIDVAADITARGGDIRLSNINSGGNGSVTLRVGATLDVRGLWTNALLDPSTMAGLAFLDGGGVTLQSVGALVLEQGSLIDVSSGAAILVNDKTKGGKGGDVSLVSDDRSVVLNGGLSLDGEIRGYGMSGGGKLSIQTARAIVVSDHPNATPGVSDPLHLLPSLFRSGFGDYVVRSTDSLIVSDNTHLTVEMPVYRLNAQSFNVASGAASASALELWTPPEVIEDPLNRVLLQRGGASLTLAASIPGATPGSRSIGGPLTLGHGATMKVDAGQSVRLEARGQITIDGAIVAHGGDVTIVDTQRGAELRNGSYDIGNQSIWLGATSRIDISGQAWQARDARGHAYGLLLAGGSVLIGSEGGETNNMGLIPSTQAFIIQREGSIIDASGVSLAIDIPRSGLNNSADSLLLASDGGTIAFNSSTGIFLDGTLTAHKGGAGASGGMLSIALETPVYSGIGSVVNPIMLPAALNGMRVITVAQQHGASQLASDLAVGGADPALVVGARIGVDKIQAGGFDGLALTSRDLIRFEGDVSLRLGRSLELGGVIASSSSAQPSIVDLYAPYLLLSGAGSVGSPSSGNDYYAGLVWGPSVGSWGGSYRGSETTVAGSRLTLSAAHIDVQGNVLFGVSGRQGVRPGSGSALNAMIDEAGFADVDLVSTGDIRLMSSTLASGDNLTLTAAQLYPATNATATITAGNASGMTDDRLVPGRVLAIRRSSAIDPAVPYSIFGTLRLLADVIEQGGVIRAPLGLIEIGTTSSSAISPRPFASDVRLLPGSITSVSAAGLLMPFGGTTDGQKYTYGGVEYTMTADGSLRRSDTSGTSLARTLQIGGTNTTIEDGAIVDLSGGGDLLGAAFATGRGGSVDVLQYPLTAAGPGYGLSASGNKVYAIVPGFTGIAPTVPDANGGTSRHGQQITLTQGLPGLPAGTYTLLPATFATIPGAFRVEVGATDPHLSGVHALGNGSYVAGAQLGIANTGIVNSAPSQVILTPAQVVETLSGYNKTSYAAFIASQAATFGNVRGATPADAGVLKFTVGSAAADRPLTIRGDVRMDAAEGGRGGIAQLQVNGGDVPIEIRKADAVATDGYISLVDEDLNRLSADTLLLNGNLSANDAGMLFIGVTYSNVIRSASLTLRSGSMLSAPQILVVSGGAGWPDSITIESGAGIDTTGHGTTAFGIDRGFTLGISNSLALVAAANGLLDIRRDNEQVSSGFGGSLILNDGAVLRSRGSVALSAPDQLTIGAIDLSARDLNVALNAINIGSAGDLAAAAANGVLPSGWTLTQQTVDQLLRPAAGRTQLERLTLTTRDSLNLFGSVELSTIDPATGTSGVELALVTPAIYGLGDANDVATIRTGRLIWNGRVIQTGTNPDTFGSGAPGPVLPGGAGTGTGKLALVADEVVFGFNPQERPQNEPDVQRLALGFSTVDVVASQRITANNKGTLSVYRSGTDAASYAGGGLNLIAPLLTGAQGSMMTYKAGGSIDIAATAGSAAVDTGVIKDLGGELRFDAGGALTLDTAVALPSGRLVLNAANDIVLGDRATIDLAGRKLTFFDVDKYSWGGDLIIESANGAIVQGAGSTIDVSAVNSDAGTIKATATGVEGAVSFAGRLFGQSTGNYVFGSLDVHAHVLADFAGLNAKLNDGGFYGARGFQIKTGDLVVGDEVKASQVSISIDGGSLTINGRIDASGAKAGTIRLAARDDLTLASSAVLDVHATQLHIDSYGAPIDAKNRGGVELTSSDGWLNLNAGSTIDLFSFDNIARGRIELNAGRTGGAGAGDDTAGDIRIAAAGPLNIAGAASIGVNGFWKYSPTDADGTIVQDNGGAAPVGADGSVGLNQIDQRSVAFMDAALANVDLQARLAGLRAYDAPGRQVFHLRPGVEINSSDTPTGNLTVKGDLDLSGYRYGPNAIRDAASATYGAGEAGALVIRASNGLTIKGSITDGFGKPLATPDDNGWGVQLPTGRLADLLVIPVSGITLGDGSTLENEGSVNFDIALPDYTYLKPDSTIPIDMAVAYAYLTAGTQLTAAIYDSAGAVIHASGTVLATDLELYNGEILGAGFTTGPDFYAVQVAAGIAWSAGRSLSIFQDPLNLDIPTPLHAGAILPAGSYIQYVGSAFAPSRPTGPDGTQGKIWAMAPMLAPGSQSWSMRLASGADIGSADTRSLLNQRTLAGAGNLTLDDLHFSGPGLVNQALSVIRTGTGDLDLLTGGSYVQKSLFGIYTAGTQSSGVDADHQLGLPIRADGTVLGASYSDPANPASYYAGAADTYQAWYPDHGGNLNVTVQGDLSGYALNTSLSGGTQLPSDPANWLWRQGGADIGQRAAWWINFGTYVSRPPDAFSEPSPTLVGFSGFGALGGGNVAVTVGGDAGVMTNGTSATTQMSALDVAVGATGRVFGDGSLLQTGGGDLTIKIGGALNRGGAASGTSYSFLEGVVTNLRGDTNIAARSIGSLGVNYGAVQTNDPRPAGDEPATALGRGGIYLALGDSAATLRTRGDLVLGTVLDPGRQRANETSSAVPSDPSTIANVASWFTLWTDRSAVNLFAAGGDLTPNAVNPNASMDDRAFYYPGTLRAVAGGGNIYGRSATNGRPLELAPFANAAFELLAQGSIYGNAGNSADGPLTFAISGADPRSLATPFRPAYQLYMQDTRGMYEWEQLGNNAWDGAGPIGELFRYGNDNATGVLHANNPDPARVYALNGDIEDFRFGYSYATDFNIVVPINLEYASGLPLSMRAGRDIVSLGSPVPFGAYNQLKNYQSTLIVHGNPLDVSTIRAGRDIFYANVTIAGPGTLDVSAGRNIYQGGRGTLHSIGPIGQQPAGGAGISVAAGVGANGPAYSDFAKLYLDPANLADPSRPLADQQGKVAKTYADELAAWLKERYGWSQADGDALAYFQGLAPEQQGIFLRTVYFEELRQGGREYNDANGRRFGSYLRGRQAIATLFPDEDASGGPITYAGDITMFGERQLQFQDGGVFIPVYRSDLPTVDLDGAILTDFGGDVQMLTPGGGLTIGVDGVRPVKTSGLLTQGFGDIQVYSRDSIRLGLSRVFTTFGGDITMWSALGDINAGRGAKTTVVYAPARRVYDNYGLVTLSPTVPTTGAGIATLNPIPEVKAGDIDLIAPLGTIDAGEAGIRFSGNANFAALQIINAANITGQGTMTGVPQIQAPNIAGLTQASNTAAAAAAQATTPQQGSGVPQPSIIIVEVLGFGGGGGGGEEMQRNENQQRRSGNERQTQDSQNRYQVIGAGGLSEEQTEQLAAENRKFVGR